MAIFLRNGEWYIDYYVYGHRKREKIGSSKALAQNVLRKRKVEIAEGKYLDIKKEEKIRFEDFCKTFLDLHSKPNKKPSSLERDITLIKNLSLFFGGFYLYAVTQMMVEEYKTKRIEEGKKPATVNRELACLKCIFNKAIEWGKATDNPVRKVKLLRENNQRMRYLEKEEAQRLIANCSDHLKPVVIVALNTGMRRGEILNLKWKDIDINQNLIYLMDTKNGDKREVPMNEFIKKTLISIPKHPDSPYIFCNGKGTPYYNLRKSFAGALEKSGITDFKFHDLRHTFASQLVMSGIDLKTVQELLGHKSFDMTLRYSHLSANHKKRAVDILAAKMDTIWTPEMFGGLSSEKIDSATQVVLAS